MCSGHVLGRRGTVSEQEKVVGIKSYEGMSVFLEHVACMDGFPGS